MEKIYTSVVSHGNCFIVSVFCYYVFVKKNILNSPRVLTIKFHLSVWPSIELVWEIQKCPTSRRWCCSTSAAHCLPDRMRVQNSNSDIFFPLFVILQKCRSKPSMHTVSPPMKPLNVRKNHNFSGSTITTLWLI